MSGEQHVTLDWGQEKVHLASSRARMVGGRQIEEALCGYAGPRRPRESTEDAVDEDHICKRCLAARDQQEEAPR